MKNDVISWLLPICVFNIQVTELRTSRQPDLSHLEEELREKGEKKITSWKKVVDNGGARVTKDTLPL